ncbi:BURP domain-containing protein 3-like [Hevea brasiliensis]|uniref:BURP domain-containing protein 3-like n=1 Tax=Hevea brasiliensis TaxID=3981 RepID=UPI0025E9EFE9|nr:BURP domain-containing protein 3-like [Hevea brasiliensis]
MGKNTFGWPPAPSIPLPWRPRLYSKRPLLEPRGPVSNIPHRPKSPMKICEIRPAEAEKRICARDMESMLDFVHRSVGSERDFKIVETKHPTTLSLAIMTLNMQRLPRYRLVSVVTMGDKVEAIAICHMDSSGWSFDHIA